jgi:hypothetical protein
MLIDDIHRLSDNALLEAIVRHNRTETTAAATVVGHLAELEARELHLALGFRSLYGYCRRILHLAEHEAYNRMLVARVARRFPVVVAMLAEGRLHLTAVRLLAPHLQDEDHLALLGGAIHQSKAEVIELLARWFPKPDVATSIRRAPARGPRKDAAPAPGLGKSAEAGGARQGAAPPATVTPAVGEAGERSGGDKGEPAPAASGAPPATPRSTATVAPLSGETYLVRLTARRRTVERLRRAQELLSNAIPDGDVDEVLFRALGELIGKLEAEGRAAQRPEKRQPTNLRRSTSVPPPRPVDDASRHVPRAVEREVRRRDDDRCAFVGRDGRRCEERRFLHLHHVRPWAIGGPPTAINIELRCSAHNQYEARQYFGPIAAERARQEDLFRNEFRPPLHATPASTG